MDPETGSAGDGVRLTTAFVLFLGLLLAADGGAREYAESRELQVITAEEVLRNLIYDEGPVVIDARPPPAHARGHIPGTRNFYSKLIYGQVPELMPYRDRGIAFYCENGLNSRRAGLKLLKNGFRKVFLLKGNLPNWQRLGYPIEVSPTE